ncbi:uncharacterized protein UV8b_03873 [Ustilaginoidea virens]|uniref:Uncharacterized protein n=1 Tax=Ustilaginoidea virens TaxID=1159556 RepID=A0A8E5HQI5_USTVR|nr:uncharacterized protein UV8b_03873 [Ustilaginoidea virens]QUC19632.1 hypothetical protein UV8b_03873 [Ustilaginoidea virens]
MLPELTPDTDMAMEIEQRRVDPLVRGGQDAETTGKTAEEVGRKPRSVAASPATSGLTCPGPLWISGHPAPSQDPRSAAQACERRDAAAPVVSLFLLGESARRVTGKATVLDSLDEQKAAGLVLARLAVPHIPIPLWQTTPRRAWIW